jgi:hypothetical protein
MARICITSDLHLGITAEPTIRALVDRVGEGAPDLIVLAGDLGEPLSSFTRCLDLFQALPGTVAVLAGNHDLWARDGQHSQQLWEQALPQAVRERGMLWLEEEAWERDGLACVGSIAWYDYSAADPAYAGKPPTYFAKEKRRLNNDARFIDWGWTDPDFAMRVGNGLMGRVIAVERDPGVRHMLVVTHVPICEAQMQRKPADARWGLGNAYFGNLTLGHRVLQASKVRAIVSGHTHVKREATIASAGGGDIFLSVLGSDYYTPSFEVIATETHPSFR